MSKRNVLLIGAGFSANIGLPIAKDIWLKLFNNQDIQSNDRLREILIKHMNGYDFESFYDEIINHSQLDEATINRGSQAVYDIFEEMNQSIKLALEANKNAIGIDNLKLICFLSEFSRKKNGCGYIFSLNQDLYIENLFNSIAKGKVIYYPGPIDPAICNNMNRELSHILPQEKQIYQPENVEHKLIPYLVKLHGSSHWRSKISKYSHMIIGKQKSGLIKQEPLLHSYYEDIFKNILSESINIWVIGYSFGDEHINSVIQHSLENYDSSLFIVNIQDLTEFKSKNSSFGSNKVFFDKMSGYYPYKLNQLFPINQTKKIELIGTAESNWNIQGYTFKQSTGNYLRDDEENRPYLTQLLKALNQAK